MITKTKEIVKGKKVYADVYLKVNDKDISIEVEQTFMNDFGGDSNDGTDYTYIDGEELLTDEEQDEVYDFIHNNY